MSARLTGNGIVNGQLAVTTLVNKVLGPVPVSRGGFRKGGASKLNGIRCDRELELYCAYGIEPKLKEAVAIVNKMRSEGVSLISTQHRFELMINNYRIVGVVDGIGVNKKGERCIIEFKTGFRRSLCRVNRLPPYLLSGGGADNLNDNQKSRALIQLVSYCGLSNCDRGLLLVASGSQCTAKWLRGGSLQGVRGIDILRRLVEHCPSE